MQLRAVVPVARPGCWGTAQLCCGGDGGGGAQPSSVNVVVVLGLSPTLSGVDLGWAQC